MYVKRFFCCPIIPPSVWLCIKERITIKSAIAVPSLKRLSPSKSALSLFGIHISRNIPSVVAVSVAEISAPNRKNTTNGILYHSKILIHQRLSHISKLEIISDTQASADMEYIFFNTLL